MRGNQNSIFMVSQKIMIVIISKNNDDGDNNNNNNNKNNIYMASWKDFSD